MTGEEVIAAAELCAKCGEFGTGKCKGRWEIDPEAKAQGMKRAQFIKGESKNCPFDGKPNCYKVLFRSLLTLTKSVLNLDETGDE